MNIIDILDAQGLKPAIPQFRAGDRVRVHVKVVEGDKSRIQLYEGDVIARHGGGGFISHCNLIRWDSRLRSPDFRLVLQSITRCLCEASAKQGRRIFRLLGFSIQQTFVT